MTMDTIFTATREHAFHVAESDETPTPVARLEPGDCVRLPDGAFVYRVLEVEDLADGFVKVLWACDEDDETHLGPFTVFAAEEYLLRR